VCVFAGPAIDRALSCAVSCRRNNGHAHTGSHRRPGQRHPDAGPDQFSQCKPFADPHALADRCNHTKPVRYALDSRGRMRGGLRVFARCTMIPHHARRAPFFCLGPQDGSAAAPNPPRRNVGLCPLYNSLVPSCRTQAFSPPQANAYLPHLDRAGCEYRVSLSSRGFPLRTWSIRLFPSVCGSGRFADKAQS
jgi:hypothetical protein